MLSYATLLVPSSERKAAKPTSMKREVLKGFSEVWLVGSAAETQHPHELASDELEQL